MLGSFSARLVVEVVASDDAMLAPASGISKENTV